MSELIAVLEVEVSGIEAEVVINDVPVTRMTAESPQEALSVEQFVIGGPNKLELVLGPGAYPSIARTGNHPVSGDGLWAKAAIVEYPAGVFPGDPSGNYLMGIDWRGPDGEDVATPLVVVEERDLAGAREATWSWHVADPLEIDANTIEEVTGFLADLHASLERRDAAPIVDASRTKVKEASKAYGLDFDGELAGLSGFLADEFAHETWAMEPLDPETFDLRLCGSGRLKL